MPGRSGDGQELSYRRWKPDAQAKDARAIDPSLARQASVGKLILAARLIPHAAKIDAASFNRVGNAPRVRRRGIVFRRTTRGALPTRLNESVLTARSIEPATGTERLKPHESEHHDG